MTQLDQSRIAHLSPPYAAEVEQALSFMMPKDRRVEPLKLFRTFVKDLPFAAAMGPLGRFYLAGRDRGGAAFDLRTREIVIDRVCARCGCEYEWGVHIESYANKAGFSAEHIYSTVHGSGADDCWSEKDRCIMNMVDELHDTGTLSDPAFKALAAYFDEQQIIEQLMLAGWYHAICYLANSARTEREDWAPCFPQRRSA